MRIYLRLLRFVKPHWRLALATALLLLVTAPLNLIPVEITRVAVNKAVAASGGSLRIFYLLAAGYLAVVLLGALLEFFQGYLGAKLGQRTLLGLRIRVYEHLQRLGLDFFEARQTGEIISRATGDIESVEQGLIRPITRFASLGVLFAVVVARAATMNFELTLVTLVVVPALLLVTVIFGSRIRSLSRRARDARGELSGLLQERISGMKEIQSFVREDYESKRYRKQSRKLMRRNLRAVRMVNIFRPTISALGAAGTAGVLLYGGIQVYQGTLKAGELVAFLLYTRMIYNPVVNLSLIYDTLQQALASAERIFEILDRRPEVKDAPQAREMPRIMGAVEFRNVFFSYGRGEAVLEDIDFAVQPGEVVALVGPSGGGKTTLVKLISRFHDPNRGQVLIEGRDIRTVTLSSLRRQVGVVFQESFLFNGTIRDNIAYGKLSASYGEIMAAARAAHAHQFIINLPEEYDTLVGERGVQLSGGERQRVAIARALLSDPRILILDEATSAVDAEAEMLIQSALERLMEGRTTFIIAHRLSTVLNADRIFVLADGRIVEQGTHYQLMNAGGLYAKLYQTQIQVGDVSHEA